MLKPIHPRDLANSLDKFEKIRQQYHQAAPGPYTRLLERMQARQPAYKERFLVKSGRAYCSILSSEIAYLYSEQKVTFLHTRQHKRYLLDGSLEEIYKKLDPRHFFKVNRAFVVSHACIKQIEPFFNHRMKLSLSPDPGREVLVSRGNVPAFKAWLDG
ncbi:MAG: LytTR family transcriptional regulator [Bacteroidetes bacterium]|nr:MAG: LytTR family transcriptional regulator [Bacteroidota bacterium]